MKKHCEFCEELQNFESSRYGALYKGRAKSRVIKETENFFAIPTIGQLFEGSMLVLPKEHIETCASISIDLQSEFRKIVSSVTNLVSGYGHPIFFEHGAKCKTSGGCGIYHAHLHIVPIPKKIDFSNFLPDSKLRLDDLVDVIDYFSRSDEYLYIGDSDGFFAVDVADSRRKYPSQYFRRILVEYFELDREWDWRKYNFVESEVLSFSARI